MEKAFCILAAGRGTRARTLGTLHKALLPLQNTTVLTQIIQKCPADAELVIAVGYQKDIIREYCLACHADRPITFVEVDNYDGPGSGPGFSLNCCRPHLQRPFYLCCSDCLVREDLPDLKHNWLGVQRVNDPANWSTGMVKDGQITQFKNKSPEGFDHAWIGVAGIKDYEVFWRKLGPSGDKEFEAVSAFYHPLDYGEMRAEYFTWFDTGTSDNYRQSLRHLSGGTLGMAKVIDEVTCRLNGLCVKVFGSPAVCAGRIIRAKLLAGLVPPLTHSGKHVYAYKWIEGVTLYEHDSLDLFTKFLDWCEERLWQPAEILAPFARSCLEFYRYKTQGRLSDYFLKKGLREDAPAVINGRDCEPVEHCLQRINWEWLMDGLPGQFHGDLQPENVIVDPSRGFHLIDWRDSFAGLMAGDRYYDLAKLYGGLGMCYASIKQNLFHFASEGGAVEYAFDLPGHLRAWKQYYEAWLGRKGYDLNKVQLLTAIIYLNMSPLHIAPFDELLFNHAKYLLSVTS